MLLITLQIISQKILVPLCVLIFFWGAFALIAAVSRRPPWFLLPCLAMLAYGWTFNVGFFNYYLSLGLGFFATALVWRGRGRELILAAALAALAPVAHPQGSAWLAGCVGYVVLWRWLPGWWKLAVPGAAVLAAPVPGLLKRAGEHLSWLRTGNPERHVEYEERDAADAEFACLQLVLAHLLGIGVTVDNLPGGGAV